MSLDLKTLVIIRDAARALIDHAAGLSRDSFEADREDAVGGPLRDHRHGRGDQAPLSGLASVDTPRFRGPKPLACGTASPTAFDAIKFDIVWDVVQGTLPTVLGDLDRIIAQETNP